MIRVLVAEDSPTVRELLVEILQNDPEIEVVGQAPDGLTAVSLAQRLLPDLITMDINMPKLDGLSATKEIMISAPTRILIVSSRASVHDVELSLDATRVGALMVLPTPDNPLSDDFEKLRDEFVLMVKALSKVRVVRHWPARGRRAPQAEAATPGRIKLVAVAASTGGPAALQHILSELPRNFPVPIVVVQHIAAGFLPGFTEWLRTGCNLRVKIAEAGERLSGRTVYIAPDDRHLGVTRHRQVLLSDAPPIGGFRPSADFLFTSVAEHNGTGTVALVLTGMGRDGAASLPALHAAGARVFAQDEASSVIFGMPREAIRTGVVDEVLPLDAMADRLHHLVMEEMS